MTDEQINIAIAESVGWDCDPVEARAWGSRGQWAVPPDITKLPWPYSASTLERPLVSLRTFVPNYTGLLDAMHVVEDTLNEEQKTAYHRRIEDINGCDGTYFDDIHANARQRAEAYLRTIGKWEDSE